ncbi:serine hydrolase FSH [Hypoxylon crocopeplum]|nr:serine hydrolase FSH [Hypoxylon crocopeplum]
MLQQQMKPIVAQLPGDWEFEFLNAEMEPSELLVHTEAKANDNLNEASVSSVPKPNYTWYNLPFVEDVDRAYRRITSFIESDGPFDGLWAFSQGASMAILLLLSRHARASNLGSQFKVAVFVSAFLPPSLDSGTVTWERSTINNKLLATHVHGIDCGASCDEHVKWETDPRTSSDFKVLEAHQRTITFPVQLLLRYSPDNTNNAQIKIPSVHVRGRKETYDFVNDSFLQFFDPAISSEMIHRGGHHFPRFPDELVQFAEMVIEAVQSGFEPKNSDY